MLIKKFPEDFIVEEVSDIELKKSGSFAVYKLEKKQLNTEQAVGYISKKCNIERKDIKYAGSKDRNAITRQYITIFRNNGKLEFKTDNLKLKFLGFIEEPLSLGRLKGNDFQIIIRELSDAQIKNFEEKILSEQMIPNYFDDQRFSEYNLDIGSAILRKDFKSATELLLLSSGTNEQEVKAHLQRFPNDHIGAIKKIPSKILLFYLHAVQSFIFNQVLSDILKERAEKNVQDKSITYDTAKYRNGEFIFYKDSNYSGIDIKELPLIGFDTKSTICDTELKKIGISQKDFITRSIPEMSLEGSTRECFVVPEIHSYDIDPEDKIIKINFFLTKGAYATVFIKSLFS